MFTLYQDKNGVENKLDLTMWRSYIEDLIEDSIPIRYTPKSRLLDKKTASKILTEAMLIDSLENYTAMLLEKQSNDELVKALVELHTIPIHNDAAGFKSLQGDDRRCQLIATDELENDLKAMLTLVYKINVKPFLNNIEKVVSNAEPVT